MHLGQPHGDLPFSCFALRHTAVGTYPQDDSLPMRGFEKGNANSTIHLPRRGRTSRYYTVCEL
jgi:hypothetical protein